MRWREHALNITARLCRLALLICRTQSEQAENGPMETTRRSPSAHTDTDMSAVQLSSSIFSDIPGYIPDSRGRVTVYCISEALKLTDLQPLLVARYPDADVNSYSEVLHAALPASIHQQHKQGAAAGSLPIPIPDQQQQQQGAEPADCFFFEYGVCCFWGLSAKLEQEILNTLAKKAQEQPLPPKEVEVDQFEYNYSTAAPPSMQVCI